MKFNLKSFIVGLSISLVILASVVGGALADRLFVIKPLDYLVKRDGSQVLGNHIEQTIVNEESQVIDVSEKVSPSVVTVSVVTPQRRVMEYVPFQGFNTRYEGGTTEDIGSGFVVRKDGLIVTNKHVVDTDGADYKVITQDEKEYEVKSIIKDPSNDLAILKIESDDLPTVSLGESSNLKVGQFVVAIGTALGEFRHTVTTGVISGLGRGIDAGSPYQGFVERLDDVIQTDAAINPGNSGGPLLNSSGEVIGVNVAVAQGAQNVGFALPVNLLKDALKTYETSGNFASKAFLGVRYQMITKQAAILNEVPEGAYVIEVVEGSSASNAGIEVDDIITKINGEGIDEDNPLADVLNKYKAGDKVKVTVYREDKELEFDVTLSENSS